MGWVKLDDGFAMHPKVVGLSLEARWAYVEALCYAARYRTDGIVPDVVAANGLIRQELLACGLWENGPASAILIHDYLAYNMSRGEYDDKAMAGAIGAATRWGDSTSDAAAIAVPSRPVPNPELLRSFDEFWAAYPRRVGKPRARSAYRQALKRASAEDIILGAKHYAEDPNRVDEFTAHPTTWLNRDGWNDPPQPQRTPKTGARPPDPPRPMTSGEMDREIARALKDSP